MLLGAGIVTDPPDGGVTAPIPLSITALVIVPTVVQVSVTSPPAIAPAVNEQLTCRTVIVTWHVLVPRTFDTVRI